MPDAIITSTASTFGTISGTFAADQSTVTGTVTGVITGTLSGSVGVPGPQGPTGPQGPIGPEGPPGEGGTWGTIVGDIEDQVDLWSELGSKYPASNPSGFITASALSPYLTTATANATFQTLAGMSSYLTTSAAAAGYYPLSGNPSGFLTAASLSGYATESWVTGQGYITSSALTPYLTKADNLASVASVSTARDNLGLGSLSTPTFAGVTVQGSGANVANLTPTSLSLTHATSGSFVIQPSVGITFPDASVQTTAYTGSTPDYITSVSSPLSVTSGNLSVDLSAYLTTATASATYQTLSGMSDYLSKAGNLAGLASTSTARTNLGLGSLAVINDAPSDGSQYARKNGAWDVVTATSSYITSVSSPLSVTSGNLTIDLSPYAPLASPALTGNPTAPTATFGDNDTSIATTAFVQSALAGGTAVARNLEVEVRNQSGSTIPAGSIVYISGATGNKPLITLAQANNDTNSAQTIGFVKTSIANNGTGYVIIRGELENIDTSALTEGVQLYLSPTTAGAWTTTKPSAPSHLVYVGICVRAHPTLGTILVAVQNGYELDELHDVAIASKTNNDLLAYESSTDLWKNKSFGTLGLLTSADAAATYTPLTGASDLGTFTWSAPMSSNSVQVSSTSIALNGSSSITLGSTGVINFGDTTQQTTAYPGSSGFLLKADNLSGLASTSTARTNLGLGTMAVETASNYLTTATASSTYQTLSGMSSYLTTASAASTYFTIASAASKADLASPTFTGVPAAPTASPGTNTTQLATTAFVTAAVSASTGATWGSITGTLSSQTDLQSALDAKLSTATAASTYQTLSGMSSYLTTSTAASTYQTIAGMSSYLTTASAASTYAPLASPALTGNPTAPTPSTGDNDTSIATTAFVKAQGYLTSAPVTSVAGRTGAVTLVVADVSGAAPLASPTFTGTVTIPSGASISGYATTASLASYAPLASPALTGTPTAPTATAGTSTTQIATTAFVTTADNLKANLASPAFTGTPTAPTATAGTNTTQIATTAFVQAAVSAGAGAAWGSITGTLSSQTDLQSALDAKLSTATAASTYAPLASPALTGTPTAPTATAGTSTTQLATTAFVTTADNLKANLASPAFTGTPTAPTATAGTNTTQIATTAFVTAAIPTNNVKAWVNFNGTGTVAIRASMNVSSITDNGTGNYTINFTTSMASANYACLRSVDYNSANDGQYAFVSEVLSATTSSVQITTGGAGTLDCLRVDVAVLQ